MKKYIIYTVFVCLFFQSCFNNDRTPILLQTAGKSGEVIVVMEKSDWTSEVGDTLRQILASDYAVLPQSEPSFDLINIPQESFNTTFQINRNVIILKMDKDLNNEISVRQNVWAKPQIVIYILAKSEKDAIQLLHEKRELLYNTLESAERDRTMEAYFRQKDVSIDNLLKKEHHISLTIPTGYNLDIDSSDFVWISHETPEISQGIFIYHYPYTDDNTFTKKYLIKKRNEFLKKYVPGPNPGTYMATEDNFNIEFREYSFKKKRYIAVLKGLWRVENGFMGGPFVSITTLDETRNQVVTIEGYVYAPRKEKRNYIRQLEAILYSFDIVAPEKVDSKTESESK